MNHLIHVSNVVDKPNSPLYNVLANITEPTADPRKPLRLVVDKANVALTTNANFKLASVLPVKDDVLKKLNEVHAAHPNSNVLLHADLPLSGPKGVDNHLKTILQAIKQFITEQDTKLSTGFKIFISSGINQHAPEIIDNGKLAPIDKVQLESLEKIPAQDLVPYLPSKAPSNGIGYLNALALDASSTLCKILESAFGSVFKPQAS